MIIAITWLARNAAEAHATLRNAVLPARQLWTPTRSSAATTAAIAQQFTGSGSTAMDRLGMSGCGCGGQWLWAVRGGVQLVRLAIRACWWPVDGWADGAVAAGEAEGVGGWLGGGAKMAGGWAVGRMEPPVGRRWIMDGQWQRGIAAYPQMELRWR